jgi:uncharacterized protein (DUF302 family)
MIEAAPTSELAEYISAFDFASTVERLSHAIEAAGLTIFAQVDHAAGAREAGLAMPPTLVIIYGNAKGGTPIMQAVPQAALDLPLRVLVREAPDGRTMITFHPIAATLACAGVPSELTARLEPAQELLWKAVE